MAKAFEYEYAEEGEGKEMTKSKTQAWGALIIALYFCMLFTYALIVEVDSHVYGKNVTATVISKYSSKARSGYHRYLVSLYNGNEYDVSVDDSTYSNARKGDILSLSYGTLTDTLDVNSISNCFFLPPLLLVLILAGYTVHYIRKPTTAQSIKEDHFNSQP